MNKCIACDNKASYYILDIMNGSKAETYLCSACLDKFDKGYLKLFAIPLLQQEQLNALNTISNNVECHDCGMTLSKFLQYKRVGCAKDYELFNLGPVLESYHKSIQHVGKIPSTHIDKSVVIHKIEHLKNMMDKAVKSDEFEEAARLRDEIKDLSRKMDI